MLRIGGVSADVDAVVSVPGSKSVANRALVCAALVPTADVSVVEGVPQGDDCVAMVDALRSAGACDGTRITGGMFPGHATAFDAGIAGTTSRFLTAVAALSDSGVTIDGGAPLRRRPMSDLHDALASLGADVSAVGEPGHLPVRISRGNLHGGEVTVRGDVSSQFISALMLLAPRLTDGLLLQIEGPLVSRPYVEMTAQVMRSFGADVTVTEKAVSVGARQYVATRYSVEPDFSSAAFPVMALAFRKGSVRIPSLGNASMQGDSVVLQVAEKMGMKVLADGDDIVVERSIPRIKAVDIDLKDASDLVPAVATACAVADGVSTIRGVGFIRAKESDRLGDFATEMVKVGCVVDVLDDGLRIHGGTIRRPARAMGVHHDHRLAMAFALLCGSGHDVVLEDGAVVSKSWPDFFGAMGPLLGSISELN